MTSKLSLVIFQLVYIEDASSSSLQAQCKYCLSLLLSIYQLSLASIEVCLIEAGIMHWTVTRLWRGQTDLCSCYSNHHNLLLIPLDQKQIISQNPKPSIGINRYPVLKSLKFRGVIIENESGNHKFCSNILVINPKESKYSIWQNTVVGVKTTALKIEITLPNVLFLPQAIFLAIKHNAYLFVRVYILVCQFEGKFPSCWKLRRKLARVMYARRHKL